MPSRKETPRRKPLVKRLLDGLLSRSSKSTARSDVTVEDESQSDSSDEVVSSSSSMLKRHEEVKKNATTSPGPTLLSQQEPPPPPSSSSTQEHQSEGDTPLASANSQFFYSPMYRRYFGLTPPNPRLFNPRLLEDYIDWYINVYMEEELPWQWIDVGNRAERVRKGEDEAEEEAKKLASTPSTSAEQQ